MHIRHFRYRRKPKRESPAKRRAVLFLALGAAVLLFSEFGLSSVSEELTREVARGYILAEISSSAEKFSGEFEFADVTRDSVGNILSVETDSKALLEFRNSLMQDLQKKLNKTVKASVPVGSLTDIALLSGRGFSVPIRLKLESSIDITFRTEFVSAGINQSLQRVVMLVEVSFVSESKRFRTQADVQSETVVSETVIVGRVPEYFIVSKAQ